MSTYHFNWKPTSMKLIDGLQSKNCQSITHKLRSRIVEYQLAIWYLQAGTGVVAHYEPYGFSSPSGMKLGLIEGSS